MEMTILLIGSALLQFAAAIQAFRLIRITGARKAWAMIACAIAFMAARRVITLANTVSEGTAVMLDPATEWVSLVTSAFMLVGVSWIAPWFHAIQETAQALAQSEEKYRHIFEHAVMGIFQSTPEGRFVQVNPAMARMFGDDSPEAMLSRITDIQKQLYIDPEQRMKLKTVIESSGTIQGFETTFYDKNGELFWVSIHARVVRDAAGKVLYYEGTLENITGRKHAEAELAKSEERYRCLFETAPDIIFTISAPSMTFTSFNPAFDKISDWPREEVLGKPFFSVIHPEDQPQAMERFEKTLKGIAPARLELRTRKKNGEYRNQEMTVAPLIENGKIVGIFGLSRDVTDRSVTEKARKRLETQLRQAQKMEALGTLAGGVAHDFNNILSIITGFMQLALVHLTDTAKARELLEGSLGACDRAVALVRQILAFSRQTEPGSQPTQISLIAKEVTKLLRAAIPTTIEIREEIASTSMVLMDPTHMHQILMNLCTNAADAMQEKGGVLTVSLRDIVIEPGEASMYPNLAPGPYIRLTVGDTGHGMAPSVMGRIFDPYFTTKGTGKGTGLGLAVVHGIVSGYGGNISVYSEPGEGSTFHVLLPRFQNEIPGSASHKPTLKEPMPRGKERILFVDDEVNICKLSKDTLGYLGYSVDVRASSVEALEAFRAQPDRFDLVITDQTMPQMTGNDLAKELLRLRPGLPIILCTGFSGQISREKALAAGIREIVTKPVMMRQMAVTIRRVLDNTVTSVG